MEAPIVKCHNSTELSPCTMTTCTTDDQPRFLRPPFPPLVFSYLRIWKCEKLVERCQCSAILSRIVRCLHAITSADICHKTFPEFWTVLSNYGNFKEKITTYSVKLSPTISGSIFAGKNRGNIKRCSHPVMESPKFTRPHSSPPLRLESWSASDWWPPTASSSCSSWSGPRCRRRSRGSWARSA